MPASHSATVVWSISRLPSGHEIVPVRERREVSADLGDLGARQVADRLGGVDARAAERPATFATATRDNDHGHAELFAFCAHPSQLARSRSRFERYCAEPDADPAEPGAGDGDPAPPFCRSTIAFHSASVSVLFSRS